MIRSVRTTSRRTVLLVCACLALTASLLACQVPVFRYALERWEADRYRVLVLSEGALSEEQTAALKPLSDVAGDQRRAELQTIDVKTSGDAVAKELWDKHRVGAEAGPLIVALYPPSAATSERHVAHVSSTNAQNVEQILNSPVRAEVVNRLTGGQSAVWILIESGDQEKDLVAQQTLEAQIEKDALWLALPSAEELEIDPEVLSEAKIKLKIEFSVITVKRDDPQEKFLLDCLLNSESDLQTYQEPVAFPVFGRGRVLYALVGKGISAETIRTASAFIVGPCSCQVKNQNPGFDLLLTCDWASAVGETFISQPIPGESTKPKLLTIPPGRAPASPVSK